MHVGLPFLLPLDTTSGVLNAHMLRTYRCLRWLRTLAPEKLLNVSRACACRGGERKMCFLTLAMRMSKAIGAALALYLLEVLSLFIHPMMTRSSLSTSGANEPVATGVEQEINREVWNVGRGCLNSQVACSGF